MAFKKKKMIFWFIEENIERNERFAIFKIKNMEWNWIFPEYYMLYLNINLILLRRILKKFKKIENCRISRRYEKNNLILSYFVVRDVSETFRCFWKKFSEKKKKKDLKISSDFSVSTKTLFLSQEFHLPYSIFA